MAAPVIEMKGTGGSGPGLWVAVFGAPFRDLFSGLERLLAGGSSASALRRLGTVVASLLFGWWLYVPAHEFLHAAACLLSGGTVSRLEISPLYLGAVWEGLAPWIVSGGPYAGRLAGFDTGGSDMTYLATVFGPYLLTIFPGIWALRVGAARRSPLIFGASIPVAFAPFVSLTGDAYEVGSIVATSSGPWSGAELQALIRGDDLFVIWPRVAEADASLLPIVVLSLVIGALWAFATYGIGALVATRLRSSAKSHTTDC